MTKTKKLTLCSLLAALALGIGYLEGMFPITFIPLPGVKLGLANIVTLFALMCLGPKEAYSILMVRILLGSIFAGNGSAFLYSLLGGLLSMTIMVVLSKTRLSIYGISIAGAAAHQCGQILAAMITLKSILPVSYLPWLLLVSLITGALTGLVSALLCRAFIKTNTKGV